MRSSSSSSGEGSSSAPQYGGGGYDGKTYADVSPQVCPDKSFIKDRIIMVNQLARFTRENCADLTAGQIHDVPATVSGQDVQASNLNLHLETVPPTQLGEFTTSELGDYAPAVSPLDLGPATYFQAAPLGSDRILSITASGVVSPLTLHALLLSRSGMALTAQSASNRTVSVVGFGDVDTTAVLSGLVPLGDSQAILFAQQSATQYKILLFSLSTGSIASDPAADLVVDAQDIGGQALDANNALLWYRRASDGNFAFRILTVNAGAMSLGAETSGTGAPFAVGAAGRQTPAFLAGAAAGSFYVVIQDQTNLSSFTLQVASTAVTFNNDYAPLTLAGTNPQLPVLVGAAGDGFLVYSAEGGTLFGDEVRAFHYARFTNGVPGAVNVVPNLLDLGSNTTDLNASGSANLLINNLSYFHLNGTRIVFLNPGTTPMRFNIELPSSIFQVSELFASGDKLAGAGIWNGNAYLSVLSAAH